MYEMSMRKAYLFMNEFRSRTIHLKIKLYQLKITEIIRQRAKIFFLSSKNDFQSIKICYQDHKFISNQRKNFTSLKKSLL